ncbi:MAG: tetratricopeptide repeat protein, partial [Candidatus Gastranaerophilales bacterium]|nr:tetratricopeptide repeat protein [Candidatus Gastranaerophilales bacterium]
SEFEEKLKATATLLEKDKNNPKARQELLELENEAGENGVNLANVAKLYIKVGENGRAKDLLNRAESLSPQNYKVIYTNAVFLYKNNDLASAEEKLLKVSRLNQGFMHAHYNLGNLYYRQNEYKKAIESFKKAMELAPENADIYFNIAMTLEAMGQKELARKFYARVLDLNPNDKEALKAVERL